MWMFNFCFYDLRFVRIMRMNKTKVLTEIYDSLFNSFGKQYWWPGDTGFEVVIGAILTQNTNWANVEKAISNLKSAKIFTPKKLLEINI